MVTQRRKPKPNHKYQQCLGATTFTMQEGAMSATYLESSRADLGKSLLSLSPKQGLCCLYLLLDGVHISPVPAPSPAHSEAASQAAHLWKDWF